MKSQFTEKCYALLKQVPKGKVITYKELAKALKTRAYRAVGNAMNKNSYKDVPCHRAVKTNGYVSGFARETKNKILLLKKECIEIINNKIDLNRFSHNLG